MHIPFNDLFAQYSNIKPEIDAAIERVIKDSTFVRGGEVDAFEENFASMMEAKHCVSCANGTDALYIGMHALGLKSADEVIVPAHSWISTSETVTQAGGRVVFCDTRAEDFTIDPDLIEAKITAKTVGLIPVHLYGHPAQMDKIQAIAKKHNLWIIEDCAQAHLATFNGLKVGQFGEFSTFSFYPGKNLGAMGDAGALITQEADLARRAARFARHGGLVKGVHEVEGINSRLDGLQAAILNVKLPHLPAWTKKRQSLAENYQALLAEVEGVIAPIAKAGCSHVWHLFVIKNQQRDLLQKHLADNNIQTTVNYPTALPFLDAYQYLGARQTDFPMAYEHQSQILSLPIYPEMSLEQVGYVAKVIRSFKFE